MNKRRGFFITLEGMEGAGKSTHMAFMAGQLEKTGKEIVTTREPGGTPLGEQVRQILLMQNSLAIDSMTELLLMFAARAQHRREVIVPALQSGKIVLCDRFTDSSYAYQGGGRGIPVKTISRLAGVVHPDLQPDLTLLFDVPVSTGLERAGKEREADRFEKETIEFFEKVRKSYLKLAKSEPNRIKLINTDKDIGSVHSRIMEFLRDFGLC
ncbi:MAG: dTMP kinase [Gammaproteobacteria bacterium]